LGRFLAVEGEDQGSEPERVGKGKREREREREREVMAFVGGQLTSMTEIANSSSVLANGNSGVATCFAGAAGNGGPLAAFKGTHSAFTKLPILPNIAFGGEIFVPNSYKFGGFCSHAKVSGFEDY